MNGNGRTLNMYLPTQSRRAAPGHPVKYLFHRSSFDLGPNYRNYADWQFDKSKSLYRKNLLAHFGCVNAIEFSKNGNLLVSGGDDRRVLLWNVDKAIVSKEEPKTMLAEHLSNVFSLDFSCSSDKIFSAGNDDQVIVHDIATCAPLDYFVHEQPVYGISADPVNESVFCSACDDGRILIFDIRESGNDPFCLAKATSAFHSVMFHPIEPRLLVTANSKEGVCSWDVRMPKRVFVKYGLQNSNQCCMSARFNRLGSQILVLRRRLPPILYSTDSPTHLYQFNHRGYYNSCTMKSCSFAGMNDQYVLSGSDNFDLHLWKIPIPGSDQWINKADMVLRGHRSIVNQVRYNYTHNLIASSGVEKIVKLWSPFPLPDERGGKTPAIVVNESERRIYTPDDYVSLVMQAGQGQFMSLTYEAGRKTTREDSRMLAFFDALVQRDINGISDEESDTLPETSYTNTVYTSPETSSSENEDEDSNPPNFRSLLSAESTNSDFIRNSRNSSHTDDPSVLVDNSSNQSSLVNIEGVNAIGDNRNHSDASEDTVDIPNTTTREIVDQDVAISDATQPTEDRDMTANMITQLILKKESSRRKMFSKPKSSTARMSSNHERSSETGSDSDQDSIDQQTLSSRSSITSHNSSTRPLRISNGGSGRQGPRRSTTTSSYSSSRKEFRKRLLQARRREMMSTPIYESSRNVTSDGHVSTTASEPSYNRISELMTRNQAAEQSDSSLDSSSSSSSDSSSSEESKPCNDQSAFKTKQKVSSASKKSRAIISSDSSSSDSDEVPPVCTGTTTGAVIDEESSESSNPLPPANVNRELKRKRRHPCKLNEACKALFKRYISSSPEATSTRAEEESSPCKRLHQNLSESASTSSAEVANVEQVAFKKFAKQKDRNYRKVSSSVGLSTPPDSGIDVCKEQEPCCSKSFMKKSCTTSSASSTEKPEKSPQQTPKLDKDLGSSSVNHDDLGFGQIDSEEDSD